MTTYHWRLLRQGICGKAQEGHVDGLRYKMEYIRNWTLKFKAGNPRILLEMPVTRNPCRSAGGSWLSLAYNSAGINVTIRWLELA
jgi:hypothetical protein